MTAAGLISRGVVSSAWRTTTAFAAGALLYLANPATALFNNGTVIAPCNSTLYCYGEILKGIELAAPFSDSKTFVDM